MEIESRPRPAAQEPPSPRPAGTTGSVWTWVGLVLAGVLHLLVVVIATFSIEFETKGICRAPATADDLVQARLGLALMVVLALGPWLAWAMRARRRGRPWVHLLVVGLVLSAYPVWSLVQALLTTPADWTIDWCLF